MLLLGLLLGSVVGFAYAVEPSDLSCAAIRLGTGMSYALIYSSILVKVNFWSRFRERHFLIPYSIAFQLVFLISLNTGVYLPAAYQALLFLFCVLVQVRLINLNLSNNFSFIYPNQVIRVQPGAAK